MKRKSSKILVIGIAIAVFISWTFVASAFEFAPGHIVIYEEGASKGLEIFPSPNSEYFHKVPGETGSPWEKRFMLPGDEFVRCFTIKNESAHGESHTVYFYTYAGKSWDDANRSIPSTDRKLLEKINLEIRIGGETGSEWYNGPLSGATVIPSVDVAGVYDDDIRKVPLGMTKVLVTVDPGETVNIYTKVSLSGEITNQDLDLINGNWSDHGCSITWVFVVDRSGMPTYTPIPTTTPNGPTPTPNRPTPTPYTPPPTGGTPPPSGGIETENVFTSQPPLAPPITDEPGEYESYDPSPPPLWPPSTGDESQQLFYFIALLVSLLALTLSIVAVWRRRGAGKNREN